jgi:hypothetical protein
MCTDFDFILLSVFFITVDAFAFCLYATLSDSPLLCTVTSFRVDGSHNLYLGLYCSVSCCMQA